MELLTNSTVVIISQYIRATTPIKEKKNELYCHHLSITLVANNLIHCLINPEKLRWRGSKNQTAPLYFTD